MSRHVSLLALMSLTALALAGCSSAGEATVRVLDDRFDPTTLTVDAGTEVHFEVEGQHPHTVTVHMVGDPVTTHMHHEDAHDGDDIHVTFDEPGTYHVWCMKHGQMTSGMAMVVTVE
jgi:plastocyanin